MIAVLAGIGLVLAAAGHAGSFALVGRRLVLARGSRARLEREARLRPIALALVEDEEEPGPLALSDVETLAALLGRYARHLSGASRERITAFFEERGEVARELRRLEDRRAHVRAAAAHALGDMRSAQAIPALRSALADPVRDVRSAAARSLGCLLAREAVGDLVAALVAGDVPRGVAGHALLSIGPSAVAPLAALRSSDDAAVHAMALELIGLLGDAGDAPVAAAGLRHGSAQVRAAAARALGRLGARDAGPGLRAALEDRVPFVRVAAAQALGAIGDLSAVPALLARARGDGYESAQAAAGALLRLVPEGLAVVGREPGAPPHLREAADLAVAARAA
jgi:HEAT repeat protein